MFKIAQTEVKVLFFPFTRFWSCASQRGTMAFKSEHIKDTAQSLKPRS